MNLTKKRKNLSLRQYYLAFIALIILALLVPTALDRLFLNNEAVNEMVANRAAIELVVIAVLFTALVAVVSFPFYRRIERPLKDMQRAAKRFALGNFQVEFPEYHVAEINQLAHSMNLMGRELKQTLDQLTEQRNKLEAIFGSMLGGVIILDQEGNVSSINVAAANYLGSTVEQSVGSALSELVPSGTLSPQAVSRIVLGRTLETEVKSLDGSSVLQLSASPLRSKSGNHFGTLLTLNDITQLKHLEKIRSDFVANVSHELKTPITSIKGFVETLLENRSTDPADARRFLRIIAAQSDRLTAIIEDLLTLARLESEEVEELLLIQEERIAEILQSVVMVTGARAEEKNISIALECSSEIRAFVDRSLLEQALVNLVDNAVKYSDSETTVRIVVEKERVNIAIHVIDQGMGISDADLPRLFERFYRVDKARSRKMGGTGLGLAIVKHVVGVHRGTIRVNSKLGQGSTFVIRLPINAENIVANRGAAI